MKNKRKTIKALKIGFKQGIMVQVTESGQFFGRQFYLREVFNLPNGSGSTEKYGSVIPCPYSVISFKANFLEIIFSPKIKAKTMLAILKKMDMKKYDLTVRDKLSSEPRIPRIS